MKKVLHMSKILFISIITGALFLLPLAHALATFYKGEELPVQFQYKSYQSQQPFLNEEPSFWYYKRDIEPIWTMSVPTKPQIDMPADFDGYGIIRIRAYNSSDIKYRDILAELKKDTEVKGLTKKTYKAKTLIYTAVGESSSAEALLFFKKHTINIEMAWANSKNNAFLTVVKSLKF